MTRLKALLRRERDVVICVVIATLLACSALWRLGLLWPSNVQDALVVDTARTALVAKNIVDGDGYTTNDLPASLVSFYDQRGKLHDAHWQNADRFPFAAYATAALYLVTGQRDPWTGIILYNLITFVGFITALYLLARRLSGDWRGGALAAALALLHSQTYVFLFMKDADMLWMATATIGAFHRYFGRAPQARTPRQLAWLGTLLAWSFLSRPNVGMPLLVGFAAVSVAGLIRGWRAEGAAVLARWARTDLVGGAIAALWLVPFLIHTMQAWGSPFFSANGLYQPALGTRYGMGTDTWWRYFPPEFDYSLGHLWHTARGEVIAKFTTSWLATAQTFASAYFVEIGLALAARRLPADDRRRGLRGAVVLMLIVFVFNFVLLPLYAYRSYSWRHYLGFILPVIWIGATLTLLQVGRWLAPTWDRARGWIAARPRGLVLGGGLVLVFAMLRFPGNDGNLLAMSVSRFFAAHWLLAATLLIAATQLPRIARWSNSTWVVVLGAVALAALYRPHKWHKNFTDIHVPTSNAVWRELRQRHGLVASFALQTQVSWNTGRNNIPAPEWPMNLYAMSARHQLQFEDLYIESPAAQLEPFDGLFGRAAPGFEGYRRLVQYRDHLPGYRLSYHVETRRGRPRFRVAPRAKSSTIYTLVDPTAIATVMHTPATIDLGDPANVLYTAHGFGGYYTIDGRAVVAATDATRKRYTPKVDRPWEDTSLTFFVDDRTPTQVVLDVYAIGPAALTWYWNLDLDEYTPARQRAAHQVAEVALPGAGWHTITITVPPALVRRGLNKLGFRAGTMTKVALCGPEVAEVLCAAQKDGATAARILRWPTTEASTVAELSIFLSRARFETP